MSTDYAALIAARKAAKAEAAEVEKNIRAWEESPGIRSGHMEEDREMPSWAVEPKDLDEYLREHGGRCQHGYSVAEQGCPGCGIDSPEQVVNRYLGGVVT